MDSSFAEVAFLVSVCVSVLESADIKFYFVSFRENTDIPPVVSHINLSAAPIRRVLLT